MIATKSITRILSWIIVIVLLLLLIGLLFSPSGLTLTTAGVVQVVGIVAAIALFIVRELLLSDKTERQAWTESYKKIANDFIASIPNVPHILSVKRISVASEIELEKYTIFREFINKHIPSDLTIKQDWNKYKNSILKISESHNEILRDLIRSITEMTGCEYVTQKLGHGDGRIGLDQFGDLLVEKVFEFWFYNLRDGRSNYGGFQTDGDMLILDSYVVLSTRRDKAEIEVKIKEIFEKRRPESYLKLYRDFLGAHEFRSKLIDQLKMIQNYPFL